MKLADIKKAEGTLLTTKLTDRGGGDAILILAAGDWVAVSSRFRPTRFRPAKPYDDRKSGVAVARLWRGEWVPEVLQPQQIDSLTPEDVQAVKKAAAEAREARSQAQVAEWTDREAQIERIRPRLEAIIGPKYLSKFDPTVPMKLDDVERLLDLIEQKEA